MFQTGHPFFPFPMMALFQDGMTAREAVRRAYSPEPAYQPHIPRFAPQRATGRASPPLAQVTPVTQNTPKPSRPVVTHKPTPTVTGGHKCAWPGCKKKAKPRGKFCGDTCRQRAHRANKKKAASR